MKYFNQTLLLSLLVLLFVSCSTEQDANEQDYSLNTDQLIEDLRVISSDSTEGRLTGTEGNRMAREYLLQRFEEEGAEPFQGSYTHEFKFNSREGDEVNGVNVIGQISGDSDSVIVITAHYDHIGMRDSLIFNGADDDASGTAALLAYIDYFNEVKPNHTLSICCF
ncbi:MAG: M28 family peptidase [Gracilimonas sp.]|nr:M28 family peptidase [Gracilimonas sp.]